MADLGRSVHHPHNIKTKYKTTRGYCDNIKIGAHKSSNSQQLADTLSSVPEHDDSLGERCKPIYFADRWLCESVLYFVFVGLAFATEKVFCARYAELFAVGSVDIIRASDIHIDVASAAGKRE